MPELPPRTGAVVCPDWPVIAAALEEDVSLAVPAAVLHGHRVAAVSVSARRAGVRVGMRQRDAQAACPELVLLSADPGRDARLFEPVIAAVEDLVAGIEVIKPGLVVFPAAGPVRYFGSEEYLAERLLDNIATTSGTEAFVGFAEGVFAAAIAAARPLIVPPGQTRRFLSTVDVGVLGRPQLVSVLRRCGIHTLGGLAALPQRSVVTRFGAEGVVAYQLATAVQATPIVARVPDAEIEVSMELDPPAPRIQYATAAVHTVAEKFFHQVEGQGLACAVVRIDATTESGEMLSRSWRADEMFTLEQLATRLRWQLEAWLTSPTRPTSGISVLGLVAEQVAPASSRQMGLWDDAGGDTSKATAAIDRAQDMLGVNAVTTATVAPGRVPKEQSAHTVWRDEPPKTRGVARRPDQVPAPIRTLASPIPVVLRDAQGAPVHVSDRGLIVAEPATFQRQGSPVMAVVAWAGPWSLREHWWQPGGDRRGAWVQLVVEPEPGIESALLLFCDLNRWWLVGGYD